MHANRHWLPPVRGSYASTLSNQAHKTRHGEQTKHIIWLLIIFNRGIPNATLRALYVCT